ncbi:MAG: nucleotidyltransferase domain-containing protein [Desulfobacteraceae bacterium]|nr:nucleotidyltransferase domain-containing protein [Desulfobacteraceae bacterium]
MIENTIKQYFKDKEEIAAVYLFGSCASGKERHMSDVDIGLLLNYKHSKSSENFKEEYLTQLGRLLRKDIHPVIMNSAGEVLLKQILGKGKLVLVKNSKFHKEFKMVALSKIVDFNFYLKKMHSSLTKRILEV